MSTSMNTALLLHKKLIELSRNLWWTWHPEVIEIFRDIDPDGWEAVNHNPIALLQDISPEKLQKHVNNTVLLTRVDHSFRHLSKYTEEKYPWCATNAPVLRARPVAYFSAEFGIHETLPIYSGGLGVLAGDHLKSASDLGLPMIGIGLLYHEGYFKQRINADGWQEEDYYRVDVERLPLQIIKDERGEPIIIDIETRRKTVRAMLWEAQVGRARLLLLDPEFDGPMTDSNEIRRLYGGDARTRIEQELVLGVGGMRALRRLGIHPGVLHLNEGHCAFAPLELARQLMEYDKHTFVEAAREASSRSVFTTHTPVEAGHDRFPPALVEEYLGPIRDEMGLSADELVALGRVKPGDDNETFCMTVLALNFARRANGVSAIHGRVSRKMWHDLFPARPEEEVPISHITNGVHCLSWLAHEMYELFDRVFGIDWPTRLQHPSMWERADSIDNAELWEIRRILKSKLITFARRKIEIQEQRNQADHPFKSGLGLDSEALTIGFSRRFALYKRADLLLRDKERLFRLLNRPGQPVQIIFAGKAHPKDNGGKRLIQEIVHLARDPRSNGRIVLLEDYDINVGRHIVQGVDVWLNNPRRPLEACGTSGQKALFNGALNLSILDGWWAEGYDGENGFAIGHGSVHRDNDVQDRRDAEMLYDVLEKKVIPLYYDVNEQGLPLKWLDRIKRAMRTLGYRFNSDRMVIDYVRKCYLPAADGEQTPL